MEGNEKGHDEEYQEELTSEEGDLSGAESLEEPVPGDARILEEYDRKRREGKIEYVQSVLEGILYRMGVEAEVAVGEIGGNIQLEISGDSGGLLIGKHGRTLDALQYVLNRVYQRRFGEGEKVFVDTENYRKRRVEALENLALRLGEKVKRRRRAVVAGVFNSRDRRIIHMTLKSDTLLETVSRGEGYYKKLVVCPRSGTSQDQENEPEERE
jgi:spoIIIJ-associated protein